MPDLRTNKDPEENRYKIAKQLSGEKVNLAFVVGRLEISIESLVHHHSDLKDNLDVIQLEEAIRILHQRVIESEDWK